MSSNYNAIMSRIKLTKGIRPSSAPFKRESVGHKDFNQIESEREKRKDKVYWLQAVVPASVACMKDKTTKDAFIILNTLMNEVNMIVSSDVRHLITSIWKVAYETVMAEKSPNKWKSVGVQSALPAYCSHPPASAVHNSKYLAILEQTHLALQDTWNEHLKTFQILSKYNEEINTRTQYPDVELLSDTEEPNENCNEYVQLGSKLYSSSSKMNKIIINVWSKWKQENNQLREDIQQLERDIKCMNQEKTILSHQLEDTCDHIYKSQVHIMALTKENKYLQNQIQDYQRKFFIIKRDECSQTEYPSEAIIVPQPLIVNLYEDEKYIDKKKIDTRNKGVQTGAYPDNKIHQYCATDTLFEESYLSASRSNLFNFTSNEFIETIKGDTLL